jgi:ATP-dependent Lon protease
MQKAVVQSPLTPAHEGHSALTLACLPLTGEVPFPMAVVSVVLRYSYAYEAVSRNVGNDQFWIFWRPEETDPRKSISDLPEIGIVCRLLSSRELGPGQLRIDLEGLYRARRYGAVVSEHGVEVNIVPIDEPQEDSAGVRSKIEACYSLLFNLVQSSEHYPSDLLRIADLARERADHFTDRVASAVHFPQEDKWRLAQTPDPTLRLDLLTELLRGEVEESGRRADLARRVKASTERRQKADLLRSELVALRKELESVEPGANELDQLSEQIAGAGLPVAVARRARNELERLRMISTASAEYTEIRNYIDWLIHIPWTAKAHERTDGDEIRRILDSQFYGQKRAKDRVCEYLAVMHRTGRPAPNVLCLTGASGIGKTQLAKGIAKGLRRPLITLNLGLLRSEGVLRGNRRTFPRRYARDD